MTTARDVIEQALRKIKVTGAGETASAEDAADALDGLNGLMSGLKQDGVDFRHTTLDLSDDIGIPASEVRGIVHMLAVELAPDLGKDVPPEVAIIAERARTLLQATYAEVEEMTFPRGLRRRRDLNDYDIDEG